VVLTAFVFAVVWSERYLAQRRVPFARPGAPA
jgi:hypothetical protein